jgi:hypothetical protein
MSTMRRVEGGLLPCLLMVVLLLVSVAMSPQASAQAPNIADLMGQIVELSSPEGSPTPYR